MLTRWCEHATAPRVRATGAASDASRLRGVGRWVCGLGPLAWAGGSRRRAGEGARSEENCGDSVKGKLCKLSVDLNLGHNLEPHRPHTGRSTGSTDPPSTRRSRRGARIHRYTRRSTKVRAARGRPRLLRRVGVCTRLAVWPQGGCVLSAGTVLPPRRGTRAAPS